MNERERIELLMKSYGLTPSQFADRTGIQRASVSHIISGRNKPSLEVLQKIYEAFPELDIKWLMTGRGEEPVVSALGGPSDAADVENSLFSSVQESVQVQQPLPVQPKAVPEVAEQPRQTKVQSVVSRQAAERPPKRVAAPRVLQSQNNEKRIKEIRVFYTDGTYETMFPEK